MDGKRLIRSIKLTNLLSFGPKAGVIELEPLNVLIGPNASGKSNFIEAIELLHAAPTDLAAAIRRAGGISELIWKGGEPGAAATIEAVVDSPLGSLLHHLAFAQVEQRYRVVSESVRPGVPEKRTSLPPLFYQQRPGGCEGTIYTKNLREGRSQDAEGWTEGPIHLESAGHSVLSQVRGREAYPAITHLATSFAAVRLYRESNLGSDAASKRPQPTDEPDDFLLADAGNLGMVLNDLQNKPETWKLFLKKLKRFYDGVEHVSTKVQAGTVQVLFHERGLKRPVPGTRLSDGTVQLLCLLAILCHPEPPPLVVIEEPELGLHPDALGLVAELLLEASQRMQLIVTTHSDALVSELSDVPESVLVCERDDDGTHLKRLDKGRLKEWLEEYMLGDLWRMGKIGGNP